MGSPSHPPIAKQPIGLSIGNGGHCAACVPSGQIAAALSAARLAAAALSAARLAALSAFFWAALQDLLIFFLALAAFFTQATGFAGAAKAGAEKTSKDMKATERIESLRISILSAAWKT